MIARMMKSRFASLQIDISWLVLQVMFAALGFAAALIFMDSMLPPLAKVLFLLGLIFFPVLSLFGAFAGIQYVRKNGSDFWAYLGIFLNALLLLQPLLPPIHVLGSGIGVVQ